MPKPPRSPLAAFGQNIQTYPRRAAFCRTPRAASLSPMPFVEVGVATAAPRIAACRCWLSAATPLLGLERAGATPRGRLGTRREAIWLQAGERRPRTARLQGWAAQLLPDAEWPAGHRARTLISAPPVGWLGGAVQQG